MCIGSVDISWIFDAFSYVCCTVTLRSGLCSFQRCFEVGYVAVWRFVAFFDMFVYALGMPVLLYRGLRID